MVKSSFLTILPGLPPGDMAASGVGTRSLFEYMSSNQNMQSSAE